MVTANLFYNSPDRMAEEEIQHAATAGLSAVVFTMTIWNRYNQRANVTSKLGPSSWQAKIRSIDNGTRASDRTEQ